jgi:hypothetical protein
VCAVVGLCTCRVVCRVRLRATHLRLYDVERAALDGRRLSPTLEAES